MIEIEKQVEKRIQYPVHFYQMTLQIEDKDLKYLISKIDENLKYTNKWSYATNVKGDMTHWTFFNNDPVFEKYFLKGFGALDEQNCAVSVIMKESWGIRIKKGDFTKYHDHIPSYVSGILYLSKSDQFLNIPQINVKTKPDVGKFMVWTGLLRHGTDEKNNSDVKYAIPFNCLEPKAWDHGN